MTEFTFTKMDAKQAFNGDCEVILTVPKSQKSTVEGLYRKMLGKDKPMTAKIAEKRNKRSLDANAYAWVLMDKLAESTRVEVSKVYRAYIREIGGNSEIICLRDEAVETFRRGWEHNGLGWQTDVMPSKLDGCTNVKIYYGSSTYNTAQMSRLIDLIIQDCKEVGIETATPDELERIKQQWGAK